MILVFDLDDTLYAEITYVNSGFKAVAAYLSDHFALDKKKVFYALKAELKNGRGNIFDTVLRKHSLFSKKLVAKCLSVYRLHKPDIRLSIEGRKALKRFKKYPLYIVTDGNKIVQHNKIIALGVDKLVKRYFITHRYGIHNAKPSTYCFFEICKLEKTSPDQVIYIGDNINKDFVGIKPYGFRTIQVLTGPHSTMKKSNKYQAHKKIKSLKELTETLVTETFHLI